MEIAGYLASVLIGVSLGLIGGGGSILTVPVLVYLFSIGTVQATVYSLFIVGVTSIAGSVSYFRKAWVDFKTVIVFGVPSVISVFLSRNFLLPTIPQKLTQIGSIIITKDNFIMLLFAVLMVVAAYKMSGFIFSLHQTTIHWSFLLGITAMAVIGIYIGSFFSRRIDGKKLKPAFGWFILVMGTYILAKEILM